MDNKTFSKVYTSSVKLGNLVQELLFIALDDNSIAGKKSELNSIVSYLETDLARLKRLIKEVNDE